MAFPDDRDLGTRVEFNRGGVWTDITSDARPAQLITITRGRADEGSRTDPTSVKVQIRNPDGRYSPRNPIGEHYGFLGRNTPLRVSVAPTDTTWLDIAAGSSAQATTPDVSALDIVGDLDVRLDIAPALWGDRRGSQELAGKWGASGQASWLLFLTDLGVPEFFWTPDGSTPHVALATAPIVAPPGARLTLRVTIDVNNGASGNTTMFYTSTTGTAGPWVQLGAPVIAAGTTSIFSSTAAVEIGDVAAVGSANLRRRIYKAEIRNGINGTVVAAPDFTAQTPGATSFTDSAGRVWTVTAGALTTRDVRGQGEVPSWPPRWGAGGQLVTVGLEAAGILRRFGQGSAPLDSTLRRRIPSDPLLLQYWACEDGTDAKRIASALPGGSAMAAIGLTFASDDSLPGSKALPVVGTLSRISGNVPSKSTTTIGWRVEFVFKLKTLPATESQHFTVLLGSGITINVNVSTALHRIQVLAADGTLIINGDTTIPDYTDDWTRLQIKGEQSGGTVNIGVTWVVINTTISKGHGVSYSGFASKVTKVGGDWGAFEGMPFGHIAVFNGPETQIFDSADKGFSGETVGRRLLRLTQEESLPLAICAPPDGDGALGAQRPDTILNLLDEATDADSGGILYEPRDEIGLRFRSRWTLYNQVPRLALTYGQLTQPLEPEDDDQETVNDITVTRTGGSSARATQDEGPLSVLDPPDGAGTYATSLTLNLADDEQTPQHAGWRLHVGTFDGMRYPAITINLARNPDLIPAASAMDIGDRVTISGLPEWLPPGMADLLVQQIVETVGIRTWLMTVVCTPAGPWTVGIIEDAVLGHIRSGTSTLAAAATDTDTALLVHSGGDALWSTDAGDYPVDLMVGGELVTATAVASAVSDSFTRSTSSSWGTATSGQAWAQSGGSSSDYSINGTVGRHSLGSVNVSRITTLGPNITDFDVVASFATNTVAGGASHLLYVMGRSTTPSDFMGARIEFTTAKAVVISIRKRVAGTETQLSTTTTALTHAANIFFRARFQGAGSSFRAKVWVATAPEPYTWDTAVTDMSITAAGQVGVRSFLGTGNTNTLPVTASWDDFALLNPQTITAVRSVNGVLKPQQAGAAIDLAQPFTIAL